MWHMHLHVIRACDVPALVKSVLSYIYVVCVLWLISIGLVCVSRVILCCYVLEVSHSLVCCDLWATTSSWSSPGLHHRPHLLEVDSSTCSCVLFVCMSVARIVVLVWCFVCHVAFMLCPMYLFFRMFCRFAVQMVLSVWCCAVCFCHIWKVA